MAEAEFVNVLICRGCMEGLIEPYLSCPLSHKFCLDCANKLTLRCLECTNRLVDPEKLRGSFPCVNYYYGCNFGGNMADCADHQEECDLGPIACPFDTETKKCEWNGEIRSIWSHFIKRHFDAIRWDTKNPVPQRDVLKNIRQYMTAASVSKIMTYDDYNIVFCIDQDSFFVKFSLCPSGKLKYIVKYLAIDDVIKEKGYKYRITFGATNNGGSCTGNVCGKTSYMAFKDLINLCDDQGNLPFEILVYDKNTQVNDSAFEMVYGDTA